MGGRCPDHESRRRASRIPRSDGCGALSPELTAALVGASAAVVVALVGIVSQLAIRNDRAIALQEAELIKLLGGTTAGHNVALVLANRTERWVRRTRSTAVLTQAVGWSSTVVFIASISAWFALNGRTAEASDILGFSLLGLAAISLVVAMVVFVALPAAEGIQGIHSTVRRVVSAVQRRR